MSAVALAIMPLTARAEEFPHSPNDLGPTGLMNMPTARMAEDGEFNTGVSYVSPFRRYFLSWQIFPAVQLTFRYTDKRRENGQPPTSSVPTNKDFFTGIFGSSETESFLDRGFDLKLRLLREGEYKPQIVLGFQDFIGTGLFSGEYVVASKRYRDFDFTGGFGWGVFSGRNQLSNPFAEFSDGFRDRPGFEGLGGEANFGTLFRGRNIGFFGGVEYYTPFRGLTLKAEFDSSPQSRFVVDQFITSDSPINFGFNYRPWDFLNLSMGWERGNALMARVAVRANMHETGMLKNDPVPKAVEPRPAAWDKTEGQPQQVGPGEPQRLPRYASVSGPVSVTVSQPPPSLVQADDSTGVDAVFARFSASGVDILDIEYIAASAIVTLTGADPARIKPEDALALLDLAGAGRSSIWLVSADPAYRATSPVEIRRQQVAQAQSADRLFAAVAEMGLAIDAFDITGERAWVTVRSSYAIETQQARHVAQHVLTHLAPMVSEVTLIAYGPADAQETIAVMRDGSVAQNKAGPLPDTPELLARKQQVATAIFDALAEVGFGAESIALERREATIYVSKLRYRQSHENIMRIARIAANELPADIENITIVFVIENVAGDRVSLARKDVEEFAVGRVGTAELVANSGVERSRAVDPIRITALKNDQTYPNFQYFIRPKLRQHLGSVDGLVLADLNIALSARIGLAPGLSVRGTAGKFVAGNLDELTTAGTSALPQVRTLIRRYLQEGRDHISNLQMDYIANPADYLYTRLSAGIFEWMYGGVGGEVLYWPDQSPIAIGGTLNWVRQRDFDQLLSFRDYDTVEGHASIYYRLPFYDLFTQLHVGRYLAKDKGATIDISRRFDSGISFGLFATFTNVSAADFGEGSFDKGFYMNVPFDLFLNKSSRRHVAFAFKPLTRDGGQRVGVGPALYSVVESGNAADWGTNWGNAPD